MLERIPPPEPPAGNPEPTAGASTVRVLPPGLGSARSFAIRLAPPTLTYTLIGACLAVFFLEIAYGVWAYGTWTGTQNVTVLVDLGAKVNEYIVLGEWWRLFTAMFLHIGVMHLLFNVWALYALGRLVEAYFGHVRFGIIYLLGGLFGSLASFAFSESISAGASGAIFALTGAAAVYFFRYRENFGAHGRAVLQNMVLIIVINLAFGLAGSGVDNWGHVGGLVGGALLAWGLLPRYAPPPVLYLSPAAPRGPGGLPARVEEAPNYMVVQNRFFAEGSWVLLAAALFAAGFYLALQVNIARYPHLLG